MSELAISVEKLSKSYRISHKRNGASYQTLREEIIGLPKQLWSRVRASDKEETFWALRDVSFNVMEGEVVGIIGRNGAGKSTLLKILSRITEPTSGEARVYGRVGSLLEVGTGFHQELTGRENIFLNGAILGMSRAEIRRHFDDIVAFAEVEKFLDTPVKRYSSGMYVRLAFAVAAHLDPEILLIDEVLAVGDAEFQKKCLGKMQDVSRRGRTVFFVSHNMGAVANLCSRCFWLDRGQLVLQGSPQTTINAYLKEGAGNVAERRWSDEEAPGDHTFRLRRVRICQNGAATASVDITRPFQVELESKIYPGGEDVALGLQVLNSAGEIVLHTSDVLAGVQQLKTAGSHIHTCKLPPYLLNSGQYFLSLTADEPNIRIVFVLDGVLSWTVEPTSERMGKYTPDAWKGMLGPGLAHWTVSAK